MLVHHAALSRQIQDIFCAWGMGADDAAVVAGILVETDLRGIDSHGVSMLPMYEQMVTAGTLNMRPAPVVERDTPVLALINADAGIGHTVARRAMALACDKAAAQGIGVVSVYNSHHFGAAGLYAEMATARGQLGFITSSARTVTVIPTHGAVPMLGTNPIAFGAPAARNPPFLLDMATSTVAVNKVKVYALNDKPLPQGWVVDGKGNPVTDAALGLKLCVEQVSGGLLPLGGDAETGGHKGYGLAMFAQILGSTLAGRLVLAAAQQGQRQAGGRQHRSLLHGHRPGGFQGAGRIRAGHGRHHRDAARHAPCRRRATRAGGRRPGARHARRTPGRRHSDARDAAVATARDCRASRGCVRDGRDGLSCFNSSACGR